MENDQSDLFLNPPVQHLYRTTDPGTSREAAESILDSLRPLQMTVLTKIREMGGEVIDEHLCTALSDLKDSTVRTRRSELVKSGLVFDTGRKGKTSSGRNTKIWSVTQ